MSEGAETIKDPAEVSRRRRPWLAFALNLLWPPGGYIYAGFPRIAVLFVVGIFALVAAVLYWSVAEPPGVYGDPWAVGRSAAGLLIPAWSIGLLAGAHAATLCRRPTRRIASGFPLWLSVCAAYPLIFILALVVRAFWPIAFYSVVSSSMQPTLSAGDIVAVRGARALCGDSKVRPGDVVVDRRGATRFLHRVVAGGGQTVEMKGGELRIDAALALDVPVGTASRMGSLNTVQMETLPNGAQYRIFQAEAGAPSENPTALHIPWEQWFLLGDNRGNSLDSRFVGPVAANQICGVAIKIVYSKDPSRIGRRP